MGRFAASPSTEDLASFLQGLAPGAHVAVDLGDLDLQAAFEVSRQVAALRGQRFVVIGHRGAAEEELAARSLGQAVPLERLVPSGRGGLVAIDAEASMGAGGAVAHARAEQGLGTEVGPTLIVVCFYTEAALRQASPGKVVAVHSLMATPGQV